MLVYLGLVFAAVFLLSQGLIVPAFGESRKARQRLRKRLADIEKAAQQEGVATLLRERYLQKLSPFEQRLEALPGMERLRSLIEQAGSGIQAYRLVLISIALAAAAAVAVQIATAMPLAAVVAALAGLILPVGKVMRDRAQRFALIEEQLPDAVDVMRRALMAGHPFNAALKLVAEDMQEPIAHEFELTFADINYGNDVRRALFGLLGRVPSVTLMAFVTAVLIQRETGGNLAEILGQISSVVRGRFRFQRRVRTLSAEGRMSAWVLTLVPLVLFAGMMFVNPDYLPLLMKDPMGRKLALFSIVWGGIGIYFIRRIIRIEV
jgi:tight adherence protein B